MHGVGNVVHEAVDTESYDPRVAMSIGTGYGDHGSGGVTPLYDWGIEGDAVASESGARELALEGT